eukprot:s320_g4.t1
MYNPCLRSERRASAQLLLFFLEPAWLVVHGRAISIDNYRILCLACLSAQDTMFVFMVAIVAANVHAQTPEDLLTLPATSQEHPPKAVPCCSSLVTSMCPAIGRAGRECFCGDQGWQ